MSAQKNKNTQKVNMPNEAAILTQKNMPDEKALANMHDILSAMADPTRLQILLALRDQELCVYDICYVLNMSQSAVSHQLRTLRNVHCVRSRREGKAVFYSLDDEHVTQILNIALSHVHHQ